MQGISWQKCANATAKKRLKNYIVECNKIAHGTQVNVSKAKVQQFKKCVTTLADKLDDAVAQQIHGISGTPPW